MINILAVALALVGGGLLSALVYKRPTTAVPVLIIATVAADSAFELPFLFETAVGNGTVVALGGVGLLWHIRDRPSIPVASSLWLILAVLAVASYAWSSVPTYSAGKAAIFLSMASLFLLGIPAVVARDPSIALRLERGLFVTLCLLLLANVLAAMIPGTASWHDVTDRFRGVMGHPNGLGKVCSAIAPFVIVRIVRLKRRGIWLALTASVFLPPIILLAHPRASTLAILVASGVGCLLMGRWLLLWCVALIALNLLIFQPTQEAVVEGVEQFSTRGDIRTVQTLTGRTAFWTAALASVARQPSRVLAGSGFQAGGTVLTSAGLSPDRETLIAEAPRTHLHNAVVEIVLGLGVLGLVIWMGALWATVTAARRVGRAFRSEGPFDIIGLEWLLLVLVGLVEGLTSSVLVGEQSITSIVVLAMTGVGLGLAHSLRYDNVPYREGQGAILPTIPRGPSDGDRLLATGRT